MPQFFPDFADAGARPHDKDSEFVAFLRGYLSAAEWLALDDMLMGVDAPDMNVTEARRAKARGWTRRAISQARRDCRDFLREARKSEEWARYLAQRGAESAGEDFFFTREGHGTGFWDRGDYDRLSEIAGNAGTVSPSLTRNAYFYFMEA